MDPVIQVDKVGGQRNESTLNQVLSQILYKTYLFLVHSIK